ncbi:unnamed protein product [Arabis nemorensis]|uniref:Uncharacterized protein n=1 Tax=Arabis nemorensis TaxID=586526 RepID=A0A565BGL8_9BRAS|nr:unnamed protein product [Arabis nemorensis]
MERSFPFLTVTSSFLIWYNGVRKKTTVRHEQVQVLLVAIAGTELKQFFHLPCYLLFLEALPLPFFLSSVTQSRLQAQLHGQGDAEDQDDLDSIRFFSNYQILLQEQSREYGFIGHMMVVHSGHLNLLVDFPYGASPRPPEDQISVLHSSTTLQFSS